MSWWNLGGMNPNFKEFMEKHPNKTVIGVGWASYWRLMILGIAFEIVILILFGFFGVFALLSGSSKQASSQPCPADNPAGIGSPCTPHV